MLNKFNLKDVQSAYFGLLTEAKIDDLLEKSGLDSYQQKIARSINDRLSNKTKYVNFIIKNIDNLNYDHIINLIYIDKHSQAFPGLDTDKMTVNEIHDLVENHKHKKEMEKIHPEAEKIFEDEDVLIISPLTYEAAVYHGKGTNWCISTSNPQYWSDYTKNFEKFYFFISKKYPITHKFSKVAVQVKQDSTINEFRDRKDDIIKYKDDIDIYDFNKYKQYLKPMEVTLDIVIKKYNLVYNKSTGLYDCDGNIEIKNGSPLIKDDVFIIKFGHVKGYFDCSSCRFLTSLEGCPKEVGGGFNCSDCTSLTSLKGAPEKVGGNFSCGGCDNLISLEGAPKEVGVSFNCSYNKNLVSLKGCPEKINWYFHSYCCPSLTSLKGGPRIVKGDFECFGCKSLASLEGCPEEVGRDFDCNKCKVKFTENDVKRLCNVKGDINV